MTSYTDAVAEARALALLLDLALSLIALGGLGVLIWAVVSSLQDLRRETAIRRRRRSR